MEAYERLLRYVRVWTTSDESSTATPSTERQSDLARMLEAEMKEMGIADARMDEHCYVYGTIPATPGYEDRPRIGFIAHLDTAPDFSGEGVKPQLHENYDGGVLPVGCGNVLDPELFPHLKGLKGHTLITTDGSTLLGADDKAGIAEILTMAELLLKTDIPHGQVSLAFTPDEEIGSGAHLLDIPAFGAEYAYTVDGGQPGEINYETFNAAAAEFEVRGVSVHPGSAKGVMVNAALLAMEINSMLPSAEIPAKTEHYEGFFHLCSVEGNVEKAALKYIVRDHSASHFEARLECLQLIEKTLNEKYGAGHGQPEGPPPVPQYGGEDPALHAPGRYGEKGHGEAGRYSRYGTGPRRNGRIGTLLPGPSLPEPGNRGLLFPRTAGAYFG